MDLEQAKKVFEQTDSALVDNDHRYRESLRYYRNMNDIVLPNRSQKSKADQEKEKPDDPLHKHDSRVSSNFHQILVDQKAAYVGSKPPVLDLGDDKTNEKVMNALGDEWLKIIYRLIVEASLAGTGWLHVWIEENKFKYAVVPANEITPIYKSTLTNELLAVRRTYEQLDPNDGQTYIYDEYWTDKEATFFKRKQGSTYAEMVYNQSVRLIDSVNSDQLDQVATMNHDFGVVPFIPFNNNSDKSPDLQKYKGIIDAYDLVYNGFINDVEDVQQVILILTNYSGMNKKEFLQNLREFKLAEFENEGGDDKSGLDKLTIDIPVEARKELLSETMNNIFIQGQGVNPNDLKAGTNITGIAIKMLYGQLELKAGQLEAEFRPAISQLIRLVADNLDISLKDKPIKQTWTRFGIQNESERADIISKLADHTSKASIAKANPLVEDWKEELEQQEKDADDEAKHPDPFVPQPPIDEDKSKDDEQVDDDE